MTSPTRKFKEWWRDWGHQPAPTGLRPLHVVVLDDKAEACEAVRERVEHPDRWGLVRPVKYDVILHPVHVTLHTDQPEAPILERIYTFDDEVFEALAGAQARCPAGPDLVFIDYGLADQQAERELIDIREQLQPRDLEGRYRNPLDLAAWLRQKASQARGPRRRLYEWLFCTNARVYLYSFTPRKAERLVGSFQSRLEQTERAFPQSRVFPLDTTKELYADDPDFMEAHQIEGFYSYQLGLLIHYVILMEQVGALSHIMNAPGQVN